MAFGQAETSRQTGLLARSPATTTSCADRAINPAWDPHWTQCSAVQRDDSARTLAVVDAVAAVARELGREPASIALAWLLAKHGVASVIVGPRTVDHLRGNLAALGEALPEDVVAQLDAASTATLIDPVNGGAYPVEAAR
ncbi:aldo/keto reductase [Saccharomonospora sp. NPDC046836]|uniref:aldo/keto reductase n=1 Tax=Saccharomonospora sp. NPDC046836 TaxID=3156921 RepID=UPI00340DE18D